MPLGSAFSGWNQGQVSSGQGMAGRLSGYKPTIPGTTMQQQRQFEQYNPGFGNPYNAPRAYPHAIAQQAGDYDEIMEGYRGMMGPGAGGYDDLISKYQSATDPNKEAKYVEAPEFGESYRKAREFADTGALSEAEAGDLRARGVSPIRSMYANMERNMARQRRLGGSTSANYNAVASRMAREGGQQIADKVTDVNAGIAEMRQKGRLTALPEMTGMGKSKNQLMNEIAMQNAQNRGNLLSGYTNALDSRSKRQQNALEGMTSLYGTTPALVNTFGNQMNQQQQTNNSFALGAAQNQTNRGMAAGNIFGQMRRRGGY